MAVLSLFGLCATAPASAQVSFTRAWGWGVADGASALETCTTTCRAGIAGGGAAEFDGPSGVAVDGSADVFVTDQGNERVDEFFSAGAFIQAIGSGGGSAGQLSDPTGVAVDASGDVFVSDYGNSRVDEFSSTGAFIKAWGWGVADGKDQIETCTTTCRSGLEGGGAGQLDAPYGVAVDGSGDVFVTEYVGDRVDEFSPAGAFIKAWGWGVADGKDQFETCTTTCQSGVEGGGAGQLDAPYGVAVDGSGGVFVADSGNYRVDEFSTAGVFIKAWGWGVLDGTEQLETCTMTCQAGYAGGGAGQLHVPIGVAFDGSGDVLVTDYLNDRVDEFSTAGVFIKAWGWGVADGHSEFETCTTTCQSGLFGGDAGQLDDPLGVAVDGSGDVFVTSYFGQRVDEFRSSGGSGAAPVNTARPLITGTPRVGQRVSCSTGQWINDPTFFAYQWYRNGTLLAGFIDPSYSLGSLDEGTTLICVVTASNAAGSASAQSNTVKVPVPLVPHCPAATGTMTGTTIGLARLGMTRARARYLYRQHSERGKQYEDFFCLTPIGVRVGYASPLLLKALSSAERAIITGRVVWASTSNPYYSLDGIRPGESITTAAAALDTEPPFHIGLNYWYLARKPGYTAVLKVRGSTVEELGIATNALTTTRAAQSVLMHSFF